MIDSKKSLFIPVALIVLALCFRFASNKFDFDWLSALTPIGAILLLAGQEQKGQKLILGAVAILGIVLCDLAVNIFVYSGKYGWLADGWWVSYLLFAVLIFAGGQLPAKNTFLKMGIGALTISVIYWLFSDLIYLATVGIDISTGERLPLSVKGFSKALAQGFPFARNFFMGTMLYSLLFLALQLFAKQTQKKLVLFRN